MDALSAFKEAIDALGVVLTLAKQAKDLLPEGPRKKAFDVSVEQAERQLRIAEAQAATALGYDICQCEWPPSIMLWDKAARVSRCPKCGDERSPPRIEDPFSSKSKWRV